MCWVSGEEPEFPSIRRVLEHMDDLVLRGLAARVPALRPRFLYRARAMATVYPGGGARYSRHIDNGNQNGRVLTVIVYLNHDWEPSWGGQLRLYGPVDPSTGKPVAGFRPEDSAGPAPTDGGAGSSASAGDEGLAAKDRDSSADASPPIAPQLPAKDSSREMAAASMALPVPVSHGATGEGGRGPEWFEDIEPRGGRVLVFWSDARCPHEVLPAFHPRVALTLWYFDFGERAEAEASSGDSDATERERRRIEAEIALSRRA